ncbi:MAG: N-acetyl-gamma-glutamyl-phosphate reductase [Gammaproteobacteria bacterium]|nr:N-acetyl-gamma-glutamyl-phosphate reductase [Gammaproteobacteria bacterium]
MIRVAIVGGTGYTGVELLRLLAAHPEARIASVTSRAEAGKAVQDFFPSLRGVVDLIFTDPDGLDATEVDVVFFATPNGTAMRHAGRLLEADARVIDLSADFRLRDIDTWQRWYGMTHASPALVEQAVYGLPELNRDRIRDARLVANPGCYPTAVTLGFLPLLENDLVDPHDLVADAKSGVSGAGRKESMATQFCEAGDNFKAYAVSGHRHLPEIVQTLGGVAPGGVDLTFVPHLVPMLRGIHATLYARLKVSDVDLQAVYEERYASEPFVDVMPAGTHPDTRSVRGANTCRLAWHRPGGGDRVVVLSVEDNLVKGAAGQAIQNMNIMLGLDERTGLEPTGLVP